jgi:hypothetical protein
MASKILRLTDRIRLTIGDVVFVLAPLSHFQKIDLSNCTTIRNGEDSYDLLAAQALYIKYSVKSIEGLETYDGNKYELEFNGDELTDNCVSEILSLEQKSTLAISAWQLLSGIKDLVDPTTGEKLEGVELEVVGSGK